MTMVVDADIDDLREQARLADVGGAVEAYIDLLRIPSYGDSKTYMNTLGAKIYLRNHICDGTRMDQEFVQVTCENEAAGA